LKPIFTVTAKKKNVKKKAAPQAKQKSVATAASILGHKPMKSRGANPLPGYEPKKVKTEWQGFFQNLLELREQLVRQMNGLAEESAQELAGYSLHMADSGTDNFDRDFALSLLSSDQDAVYEIEEALKRIEKKTYGVCELTGKSIPKARLAAIPWTRFTVEAQAQLERDGALKSRRLGALGSIDSAGVVPDVETDEDEPSQPPNEETKKQEKE
jgi:RNA polymerase-binding transcription factor DksA